MSYTEAARFSNSSVPGNEAEKLQKSLAAARRRADGASWRRQRPRSEPSGVRHGCPAACATSSVQPPIQRSRGFRTAIPYPTVARLNATEYDANEYAALPVDYRILHQMNQLLLRLSAAVCLLAGRQKCIGTADLGCLASAQLRDGRFGHPGHDRRHPAVSAKTRPYTPADNLQRVPARTAVASHALLVAFHQGMRRARTELGMVSQAALNKANGG